MFSILVLLFFIPFKPYWQKSSFLITAVVIILFSTGYGTIMEFVQENYIANRSFDIADILADAAGSVLPLVWLLIKNNQKIAGNQASFKSKAF